MTKLEEVLSRNSLGLLPEDLTRLDVIKNCPTVAQYLDDIEPKHLTAELVSFAIAFTAEHILSKQGRSILDLEDDTMSGGSCL